MKEMICELEGLLEVDLWTTLKDYIFPNRNYVKTVVKAVKNKIKGNRKYSGRDKVERGAAVRI